MNLGENLIALRKKENMSQDVLAEKLDVSRQAVSKWESGGGYPETEKIIKICEIFNCSIDTLLKGKIESNSTEKNEYDKFMKKFGRGISIGIFLILVGVTLFLLYLGIKDTGNITDKDTLLGVVILLIFVLIALPFFIINGLQMDAFKRKHQTITNPYTEEEIDKFDKKFVIIIASTICLILLGVIQMITMFGLETYKSKLIPVGLFMIYITVSSPLLVYFGIQKDKYDINKYNKVNDKVFKKEEQLIGKISAVIMIITTIIYFILGFIFNLWKYNWVLYPISGMICGIFAVILQKED